MNVKSANEQKNPSVLLLSGYDAASHRYWRKMLSQQLTGFEWTQLALPDRHFSWRIRGSSVSFAFQHQQVLHGDFDLLIVTSMVDLASLRGFLPKLANIPTVLYFHENQFVYPISNAQPNIVNAQLTSIYSAICADQVLFNSDYNMASFIEGAKNLVRRLPDGIPKGLVDTIQQKSSIVPVPIFNNPMPCNTAKKQLDESPHIVWNHRWEYDKQPQVFFEALKKLLKAGFSFRLSVLGQSFREVPDCFAQAKNDFAAQIEDFGFQSRENYHNILDRADIVVSSALHDFQGLSLQEAISRGCIPVAPCRVVYPEYVPHSNLYPVAEGAQQEAHNLFMKLAEVLKAKTHFLPDLSGFSYERLFPQYQRIFELLIKSLKKS